MNEPKAPSAGKAKPPLVPAVARINVTDPYSVREWSTKYGCSTEQLRAAVTAVGNVAADVERHLKPPVRDPGADSAALREAFGANRSGP
jgi:hypothetical protein